MAQTTSAAKICMLCGEDCAGKPRVKDPQGKYMCKACHDAAATTHKGAVAEVRATAVTTAVNRAVARKPVKPASDFDTADDGGVPLEGITLSAETAPCTSCGLPIAPAVIVCPACGFNKETGKGPKKVKVSKEGPGAAAVAGAAANVLIFANPLVWLAAAVIAGAIGTGAWYMMVTKTGLEVRIVTLGIGVMVGLTVKLASGRYSGVVSGSIAAGTTLVAILAGYWFSYQAIVGKFEQEVNIQQAFNLSEEDLLVEYARIRAQTLESANQQVGWPEGVTSDTAESREDFPSGLWRDSEAAWNKATPEWKSRFKADATQRLQGDYEDAKGTGFVQFVFLKKKGMPDIRGLVMLGGALLAALFVGSGGALSGAAAAARGD